MNDMSGWDEVGTLVFRLVDKNEKTPDMIALPLAWRDIVLVEKMLLITDDEYSAESGLIITNILGDVFIIICGANVYSVQIQAPFFLDKFLPEYDIDRYQRVLIE